MVNQILCVFFQTISGGIFGAMLEKMLEAKRSRLQKWMRVSIWCFQYFCFSIVKVFISSTPVASALLNVAWISITVIFLLIWYKDTLVKRVFAASFLYFAQCIGEIVATIAPLAFFERQLTMDYAQPDMVIGCALVSMVNVPTLFLTAMIWRRVQKKGPPLRHLWVYFLLLTVIPVSIIQLMEDLWAHNGIADGGTMLSTIIVMLIGIILIFILFNQAEKDTIEKELEQTQYRFELEQQHYKAVEARREELAKIRHDYNNLLTSVRGLLKMGEYEQAQEALDNLLVRVGQTRECSYCGVPIVNALLSEKQEICDREGIMLSADLLFPEGVSVEPIDLCSVFSNLMDNAIRACTQLPPEQRHITLTAGMKGDYLVVRCENPAAKAPGLLPEGTGYGKRILRDIAQRWGGSFEAAYENGTYTATVILLEKK